MLRLIPLPLRSMMALLIVMWRRSIYGWIPLVTTEPGPIWSLLPGPLLSQAARQRSPLALQMSSFALLIWLFRKRLTELR